MTTKKTHTPVILKKPSALVQIGADLTLFERRLLKMLLSHASLTHNLYNGKACRLPLKHIKESVSPKSNDYAQYKTAIERLVTTSINWDIIHADRSRGWGACTFLSLGEKIGNELIYHVNPGMAKKMQDPILLGKLRTSIQCGFTTKYALILYEFFNDVLCRQNCLNLTLELAKTELFELFFISEKNRARKDFSHFETSFLKKSIQQVDEKSDISVDYTVNRSNPQCVESVNFSLSRHTDLIDRTACLTVFSDQESNKDIENNII